MDDAVAIDLLRQGDRRGPQVLMERYQMSVYNLSLRMLGNTADAEDATQEVFLKAFQRLEQFRTGEPFGAWLQGIARHQAIDMIRRRRTIPLAAAEPSRSLDVEAAAIASLDRAQVRAAPRLRRHQRGHQREHRPTRQPIEVKGNVPRELVAFLAPPQRPDELGRLGPYRILKVLGTGGMGVVYKAEDPHLQRLVALKAIRPDLADPTARQRFLREARAAAAIDHNHVAHVYQVGEEGGVPFLAMQLLQGETEAAQILLPR